MKNKNLFFKIYISLLIVFILVFSILSILGKKNRVGYLGEFDFYGESFNSRKSSVYILPAAYHLNGTAD